MAFFMEDNGNSDKKSWGIRLNNNFIYRGKKRNIPEGCPSWAKPDDIDKWCDPGIIVWSDESKRIENLSGVRSLELLQQLEASDKWKEDGIRITRLYHVIHFEQQQTPRKKTTKQKIKNEEPSADLEPPSKRADEEVEEEIVHLPPEAGPRLLELLKNHRRRLEEMAEAEKKDQQRRLSEVFNLLIEAGFKAEIAEVNIPNRPFPWVTGGKPNRWVCEQPPNRGVIFLTNVIQWHSCIKRNDRYWKSKVFYRVAEAFQWVEQELVQLQTSGVDQGISTIDDKRTHELLYSQLLERLSADPTSIRSEQMESESIHYHVFIEVDSKPESFETWEDSCGDPWVVKKRYLSPIKMADLLHLDPDKYSVEPKDVESFGWYWFSSVVNYHSISLAIMQAQKAWDESHILHEYKSGRVLRARYGYSESETGYCVVLGSCDAPNKPWEKQETREEHMAELAARETLCLRLNLDDYRTFLGFSNTTTTDQQLLFYMHRNRAKSKFASEEAKRESRIWLAEHVEELK